MVDLETKNANREEKGDMNRQQQPPTSRNGTGHRAYRRERDALRRRTKRENLPCAWCGKPIDTKLPYNHPMAFTADHPTPLATGGRLAGQQLKPFHRSCNAKKGTRQLPKIRAATQPPHNQ